MCREEREPEIEGTGAVTAVPYLFLSLALKAPTFLPVRYVAGSI